MQTAALIVAAGKASGEDSKNPMFMMGSISVTQRIIATFHQAGINRIAVVTGYRAEEVERHLANNGVIFLRNAEYADTQMFDSAKIGLRYLKDKCDRILFTPADIPLFTAETVRCLNECNALLASPVCGETCGHPTLISASLVGELLADTGKGGLEGALSRCSVPLSRIPVQDKGILDGAGSREQYSALLNAHNAGLVRPVVQVTLVREKPFFDGKLALLLRLVDETHSVRTACRQMQISYTGGWNMIRNLESQVHYPLIERSQGGAGGGKSRLTEEGLWLVRKFEQFEEELRRTADGLYESYFDGFFGEQE